MLTICGGCRKKLTIQDNLAGQLGRCPACNAVIKIPKIEDVANRAPDSPLPIAIVTTDPFLQQGGSSAGPAEYDLAPTATPKPSLPEGVQTDEQGYVLAIPVEDEPNLPSATFGPDSGPAKPEEDFGYGLKDEESKAPSIGGSTRTGTTRSNGLTTSEGDIFSATGSARDTAPSAAASPSLGGPSGSMGVSHVDLASKIITRCPGCGGRLAIEAQYAGKMRTCPGCATEIHVPMRSTESPPSFATPGSGPRTPRHAGPTPQGGDGEFSPEVDLESYTAEPIVSQARGVSSFWIPVVLVIGLVVGFALGILTGKYMARNTEIGQEPVPAGQVEGSQ